MAKDQYVIWLGGMKGALTYAQQNQTAVDRVVLMIKKLSEKGVPMKDIIVHASSGSNTEVITPDRSISGRIKKSLTQVNNYKNKGSLENYLQQKGIVLPPENFQAGTFERVKETLKVASSKMSKNGSDGLYVYVTQGKEDGHFGRNELDNSPLANNGIYAVSSWNQQDTIKLDNFKALVAPQIAENGKIKNILKDAETNVQLKELLLALSKKEKIISDAEADALFVNNMELGKYYGDLPDRRASLNELRTLFLMKPEAREKYWANKVSAIKASSEATTLFPVREEIGSLQFQELIKQFRDNDKDSKITVYNEIDNPLIDWFSRFDGSLTQPKFSNVCEYNSPLISDKSGHKTTKIFAETLFTTSSSNFKDAVLNAEKFKRTKYSKYGMEGKTTVHNFIAFLSQKYNKPEVGSTKKDTASCVSCFQPANISPEITKELTPFIKKKERDDLQAAVLGHFKLFPESEKSYMSSYLSFMDKMTEVEIKQLENLLNCFDPKWKE